MVKRCIGIDIGSTYLCAVQIVRNDDKFCIEKVFGSQIRRSTDSPGDMLRPLFSNHGFDKHAEVAISMPHDAIFFRNLKTNSVGAERISKGDFSALQHNFPVQPDEIIAQAYSYHPLGDGKCSVFTAASFRTSLRERLDIFAGAKIHPCLAEAPIFAVLSTAVMNHPEIVTGRIMIAYIDEHYITLTVTRDGEVLVVRSIPIITDPEEDINSVQERVAQVLSREAQITWGKVFAADIDQDTDIYLITTGQSTDNIVSLIEEKLDSQTTVVDCCAQIENQSQHEVSVPICVAEGLALRILAPEQTKGINFLEADKTDTKPVVNLKKEFTVCASLIGAIVVFLLIGLFVRLSHLEATYANIKNETAEIFKKACPQEKVVNPLVQLQQKMESFRKDSGLFASLSVSGLSPLDVLSKISVDSPSRRNIKVDDILIAADKVRINGTCDSFESVYKWQRFLQEVPGLEDIDVKDIGKQSKSGLVEFTMLMSLSTKESK